MIAGSVDAARIAANIDRLRERVAEAARNIGRPTADITIVAVSKTHPREAIDAAWDARIRDFGESRVQELRAKLHNPLPAGARMHMVGQVQTNKARDAVRFADVIHSVDRPRLVDALAREAERVGRHVEILIQVNVAREPRKAGCDPNAAADLLAHVAVHRSLAPIGLMTIAPNVADPEDARPAFRALRELRDRLATPDVPLRALSMGMSNDFEVAIAEGATHIRVGSAIFGSRG